MKPINATEITESKRPIIVRSPLRPAPEKDALGRRIGRGEMRLQRSRLALCGKLLTAAYLSATLHAIAGFSQRAAVIFTRSRGGADFHKTKLSWPGAGVSPG